MIKLDWTTISDKWVVIDNSYINTSHISHIDFIDKNRCEIIMDSGKSYIINGKENINSFWQIVFGKDFEEA